MQDLQINAEKAVIGVGSLQPSEQEINFYSMRLRRESDQKIVVSYTRSVEHMLVNGEPWSFRYNHSQHFTTVDISFYSEELLTEAQVRDKLEFYLAKIE